MRVGGGRGLTVQRRDNIHKKTPEDVANWRRETRLGKTEKGIQKISENANVKNAYSNKHACELFLRYVMKRTARKARPQRKFSYQREQAQTFNKCKKTEFHRMPSNNNIKTFSSNACKFLADPIRVHSIEFNIARVSIHEVVRCEYRCSSEC